MAISYDIQSKSRFAEEVWLCIYLINQVIDRPLAEDSIYSAKIADYDPMSLQYFL